MIPQLLSDPSDVRMRATYDFDAVIDRRERGSLKWNYYPNPDVLPMWVADMDFKAPPEVVDVLRDYVDHGIYGYAVPSARLVDSLLDYLRMHYGWEVEREWLIWLPGLVCGLNLCCAALGEPGDGALSATPIYPPFLTAPRHAELVPQTVETRLIDGAWRLRPEDIEAASTDATRLLLLCNPHNPVGRAYRRHELEAYAELACRHDWIICSDEIHCDLVLDDIPHLPIASLSKEVGERTVTLMAPSKTYNLAGLGCAFAVVPGEALRQRLRHAMRGIVPDVNAAGLAAAEAALRHGEPWRQALLTYLRDNRDLLERTIRERMPQIRMSRVEATYLAWLDVSALPVEDPATHFVAHGVGLSDGRLFRGNGYVRLNFGCPRSLLQEGLSRMQRAVEAL